MVYAEVRYAPEQHVEPRAVASTQVVEAVHDGLRGPGAAAAAAAGSWCGSCSPRCGTRPGRRRSPSWRCAYRDAGVVGFDIAGAEAGFPPTRHLDAFEYLQRENAHFTIHAGEAFGLPSIWQAIQWCGADRLGHGVRIIDDITVDADGDAPTLGRLAAYVRDKRIPLEMCPPPTSRPAPPPPSPSTRSGCCTELRFRVTVNTDNRLMSQTSMTGEMASWSRRSATAWTTCAGSRSTP